jgi:hypothetical protein
VCFIEFAGEELHLKRSALDPKHPPR